MTSGGTKSRRMWLAVASAVVVAVIATATLTLWATGFWDTSPASSTSPAVFSPKPSNPPATAKATPSAAAKTTKPSPKRLPTKAAPTQESAYTPPPQAVQPAPDPNPWPTRKQCPEGSITAHLTSVDFTVEGPAYTGGSTYVTVTGRGILTNGMTVPVSVSDNDIPDFQGLDDRGVSHVSEVYGIYDRKLIPGQPAPLEFTLQPGESITYTALSERWMPETVAKVKYWYSANDSGSTRIYLPDEYLLDCSTPVEEPSSIKSIPNTFTG